MAASSGRVDAARGPGAADHCHPRGFTRFERGVLEVIVGVATF